MHALVGTNSRNLFGQKKIMQPLGTKNQTTSWEIEKIFKPRRTKKYQANLLGPKKVTQPLGTKKNHAPSRTKKFCNLLGEKNHATSWNKKIMQPLGGKKTLNLLGKKKNTTSQDKKKSLNLSKQKNHATSQDKKNHANSQDKIKITQHFGTKNNSATSRDQQPLGTKKKSRNL